MELQERAHEEEAEMTGLGITFQHEPPADASMNRIDGLSSVVDYFQETKRVHDFPCHHCGHVTVDVKARNSDLKGAVIITCRKCGKNNLWDLTAAIPLDIQKKITTLHFYCVRKV